VVEEGKVEKRGELRGGDYTKRRQQKRKRGGKGADEDQRLGNVRDKMRTDERGGDKQKEKRLDWSRAEQTSL